MKARCVRAQLAGFWPALFLLVALLACNLNVNVPSAPKPPNPSLTPAPSEADAFEQAFRQAVQQASQSGTFNVTVTQSQLSSWLALRAGAYVQQRGYEWPLKDVQASLDNGTITLYGVIIRQNVPETPAQIIFTPAIDGNGQLTVSVQSGQFGVVGVPNDLLSQLNQAIQKALTSQLTQIQGRYKLTTLSIAGGNLTVGGQIIR
jgi:uncharacterized protein YpmS